MGGEYNDRWEDRWVSGRTQWDQGGAHLSLVHLLQSGKADELGVSRKGRALVPGCGLGYDVLLFAEWSDLDVLGLDLAPTGAAAATRWLQEQARIRPDLSKRMSVQVQDFFDFAVAEGEGFDVIYDYTFLCALEPHLRPAWASQMTALSTPSSRLITLMFPLSPIGAPLPAGGPPWALSDEIYHQLLDRDWELVYLKEVPKGAGRTMGPQAGVAGEKIGVWKRRTA